jgi:hypothetical protein
MQQRMSSDRSPGRTTVFLLAETTASPVLPAANSFARDRSFSGMQGGESLLPRNRIMERRAKEDLKMYLMNKYRALLTDKLSREDLEELQYCLRHRYDPGREGDREYLRRFVLKIREYVQEETLKREIAGIESLVMLMKPEDIGETSEILPGSDSGEDHGAGTPLKSLIPG